MLWGGRFEEELNKAALEFSSSLKEDINLLPEEIACGKAYAVMLCRLQILTDKEKDVMLNGLSVIEEEWTNKKWTPDPNVFEDVHSAIETRLYEICGEAAGKLRTGRSRNDQTVTSLRMWLKKSVKSLSEQLSFLQSTFVNTAEKHVLTIIPGYTHLQQAQPVSLAHHLLAYVEMFERDKVRLKNVFDQCDVMPLGSGALAGSTIPIDIEFLQKELGFSNRCMNSIDGVSDRDFVLDFVNACSTGMMHLSRLCEELIIWSSSEWNFAKISDAFTTGSSLMPQKKNPDIAELIRGKSNRVFANYQAVISMLKGLPLSYNRDMQEDKSSVFNSYEIYSASIYMMNEMLPGINFDNSSLYNKMNSSAILATDAADWLVKNGVPFREAHDIVGKIVALSIKKNIPFNSLTIQQLKEVNEIFNEDFLEVLQLDKSLSKKITLGSPNSELVKEQILNWKQKLSTNLKPGNN